MQRPEVLISENLDVIEFTKNLINKAVYNHISDIHLEPQNGFWRIRYRQTGLLQEMQTVSHEDGLRILTRRKLLANLDIAESRLRQDGCISWQDASDNEIRVSTCPSILGEKLVLRLAQPNVILVFHLIYLDR